MIISAANNLDNNKIFVDKLNVFPVPDGDTGTNMSLTFSAAAQEIKKFVTPAIGEVAKALATASLRGARGNSGVILSQFCRGLSKGLEGRQIANAKEVAAAMKLGIDTAYKAVMRPTEGTILTVAREGADAAVTFAEREEDIVELLSTALTASKAALDNTPELLPVLKEAGVVDAGGAGLVKILEGAFHALSTGNLVALKEAVTQTTSATSTAQAAIDVENIKFAYCTEFIIDKKSPSVDAKRFSEIIDSKGDCKLVIDDDEIVKVHIHTNHPGFVLEEAVKLGSLSRIKIDNMKLQHTSILEAENTPAPSAAVEPVPREHKKYGFVSIVAGSGLADIFRDYGVDEVIEGGQTMNPSTDDILSAAEKINADCIFVLPNNKNIILAANQAKELCGRNIVVIPTTGVPQAVTAMMNFDADESAEVNENNMNSAARGVKIANVTYAVRDTEADGKTIKEGDILGITGGKIEKVGTNAEQVCEDLTELLTDDESEFITVYYGSDAEKEKATELAERLESKYEDAEVLLKCGGQPLYYYVVAVE